MSAICRCIVVSLTALVLATWAVSRASAQSAAAPIKVITGLAATADGKPLPGATLYMLGVPPGQDSATHLGDNTTVITDAQGRFTWTLPPDAVISDAPDMSPPECFVLPADRRFWSFSIRASPDVNDYQRREIMESVIYRCETHWLQAGAQPQLAVVVPDVGVVALQVRNPRGQTLAKHTVEVFSDSGEYNNVGDVVYEGLTDSSGRLQMRLPTGLRRLRVSVTGVGFGSTGMFEVLPGEEKTVALPQLAPFARLSGVVAPALRSPGALVRLTAPMSEFPWQALQSAVDSHGNFTLEEVMPGERYIDLIGGQQDSNSIRMTVFPGDHISGIALGPKGAASPFLRRHYVNGNPMAAQVVSVHGRVTDTSGRPIAGADVYAFYTYIGMGGGLGRELPRDALTAKTGDDGAYSITGLPAGLGSTIVTLVASLPGHPPAVASAQAESDPQAAITGYRGDLVLPSGNPGLTVRVLQDGKPFAGATVRLTPQTGALPDQFRQANLLQPTAITDTVGDARFTALTPGLWDVTAVFGSLDILNRIRQWQGGTPASLAYNVVTYNISHGVAVGAGPPRRFSLSVYPQGGVMNFKVLGPNGKPPVDAAIGFEPGVPGLGAWSDEANLSAMLDKEGNSQYSLEEPGLWRIVTRFRDTALDTVPMSEGPFYEGRALIAMSPALPRSDRAIIRAVRHEPGRIRVQLRDKSGKPASGAVFITQGDNMFGKPQYAASMDKQGEAVFQDMPSGEYLLRANFEKGAGAPALGREGEPFPSDDRLTGVSLLVPQTIEVKSDAETLVTFRPQPQGYIRGKLLAIDSPSNYTVYSALSYHVWPTPRYNLVTGEFLVGPFPPGEISLSVQRIAPDVTNSRAAGQTFPITVTGGHVVHVSLTPGAPVGKTDWSRPLPGQVLLSDGVTPAWGAKAALVVPQTGQQLQMARADALGHLNIIDSWYPYDVPPGSPTERVLVAWLPGANGAVIAPYQPGQETKLILPAAVAVRGHVTVGGKPVTGLKSSFRIMAAYEGRDKLNSLLSMEATAQADGTFELAGLTPGTYHVQAARDGIWLSESQMLTVGQDPLLDLTLDIAPPGATTILHLADSGGKPLVDQSVTVERPTGPLADALWPTALTTDSLGDLRLEGLEAGPHRVFLNSVRPAVALPFEVPVFKEGEAPVEKKITCP